METWHCKPLGRGAAAAAPARRIQEMFPPLFTASGHPSDMAVFTRHETNQVTAYFSPRASRLARFFAATPCEKPPSDRIGLLVGDARCWAIFFPDRKRRAA